MTAASEEVPQLQEIQEINLPGNRLRAKREAGRMSREEVAHHLHLDVQIISALEQDNYEKLPSPMYVCGYLRSYARLLKLPEAEIVGAYTRGKEINAALIPENVNIIPAKKPINPAIFKGLLLLIAIAIVVAGLIWLTDETNLFGLNEVVERQLEVPLAVPQQTELQPAESVAVTELPGDVAQDTTIEHEGIQELVPPTAQEIEEKIAQQEELSIVKPASTPIVNTNATEGELHMVFREDSWVEVTDSNDVRHVYRLMKAGSDLYVSGKAPYKILLGKASGVDVFFRERMFDHTRFHRDEIAYFKLGIAE